jgi:phage/plasmid-like protein (TIGR03299 family)
MAHEIEQSTGKPAIAYVGEEPWHGLGEKLPAGASMDTWLRAARLEWELKRLPVRYLVDGRIRTTDERFVLVRGDTHAALSVVSDDYQIVQPREVLEFYRELMELYGYTLETAGALDGGRKVWALARTGTTGAADKGGKDELAAYVLLATSCDFLKFLLTLVTQPKETSQITISPGPLRGAEGEPHARAMQTVPTIRKESERIA